MTPAETIRARLEQLAAMEKTYTEYAHQRLSERDWHGLWDVAVNLSEVSCERDGLQLALGALGALEEDKANHQPNGSLKQCDQKGPYNQCGHPRGHQGDHYDGIHSWGGAWETAAPQLQGSLPDCSCVPFEGRKNGHTDACAMVKKARDAPWRDIEVMMTPFGWSVYDRRFG